MATSGLAELLAMSAPGVPTDMGTFQRGTNAARQYTNALVARAPAPVAKLAGMPGAQLADNLGRQAFGPGRIGQAGATLTDSLGGQAFGPMRAGMGGTVGNAIGPTSPAFGPTLAEAGAAPAGAGGKLAGMFQTGGKFAKGSMGRAGLYGAGGYLAGQLADKMVGEHGDTSLDEALTGGLTGAGMGAGIGSLVPGVGTLLGGLAGGAIGAGVGFFGPKQTGAVQINKEMTKQVTSLNTIGKQLGLDEETISQLGATLQAGTVGATSKQQITLAAQQLAAALPQLAAEAKATRTANTQALAMQQAMGNFANPYLQQAATQAALTHSQSADAAAQIGGSTGQLLGKSAQQQHSASAALNAAYATQMQMAPQISAMSMQDQVANQAHQQVINKLAGSAAGGSAIANTDPMTSQLAALAANQ